MPEIVGPITSVVDGSYWTSTLLSPANSLQLGYGGQAEQFAINMAWPYTYFCTVRSVNQQRYVQWTADGRIVISDISSSTNWDDISNDIQKILAFAYSEPYDGWFRLQVGLANGNSVTVQSGDPNYLFTGPDQDDFSLFIRP